MSISTAVSRLSALAQDSRLLIEQGRDGLAVGKIAKQLHALHKGIQALFDCLVQDCCGGRPELCAPLTATILKTLPQQ
jgi:hypothetical protein